MNKVSFYNRDTGVFNGSHLITSDLDSVPLNTPVDHVAIEGHHDHLSKKVDIATGQIVDYQPPQPNDDHEWNHETKRWNIKADVQTKIDVRINALQQIAILESTQPRIIRELILHMLHKHDGEPEYALNQLIEIDDRIAELRKQL